jgi:hypothetical protein
MLSTKAWTSLSRTAAASGRGRRVMSTTDGAGSAGGGLAAAVGTTFVTYMAADFLSNFLQHPTQLVRVICVLLLRILYYYYYYLPLALLCFAIITMFTLAFTFAH